MATANSSSTTTTSQHGNVVPSEVGWQFVPQYYGFVNKEPNRLHCFYSKTSTFVHGTEGEESKPCFGQADIHNKINSIGFENCKVFIHSVDTQASANGGIIIQVIGEMSNRGESWRKFVQTFFLAEQPNGYFVLNDIFRFLKEETIEGEDGSDLAEATVDTVAPSAPVPAAAPPPPEPVAPVIVAPPVAPEPEPVYEQPREPTPPPPTPPPTEPAPAAPALAEDAPEAPESPAPVVPEPTQTPTPAPEPAAPTPTPAHTNGHAAEPEKPAAVPAEPPVKPTPSPKPSTPAPPAVAPAATASSQPAAPPAPRSWASLAATNQKKWGSVAQDSKAVSESVSMPTTGAPASVAAQAPATSGTPAQPRPAPQQPRGDHPALIAAQSVNTPQVFVKGVIEPVLQTHLGNTLTTRFGPVKDVEIVRQKACAFLEFTTLDAARRAIIASLPVNQGGEGGIRVDVGTGAQPVRITVETKKEKGDRPPSRPHRGGPPQMNGGHNAPQGGFRGRGGARGGRGGGAPQK